MNARLAHLTSGMHEAYDKAGLSQSAKKRRIVEKFARTHGLIYFSSLLRASSQVSLARSITTSTHQRDSNLCIGTHDSYDMVFLQRQTTLHAPDHPSSECSWNIMQLDLHSHSDLPFTFIGTKKQSRTFYARLFHLRREVRHIDSSYVTSTRGFAAHFSLVASPAEQVFLTQLLSEPITQTMTAHRLPFAIEIQGDSLFVIAEDDHLSVETLTKMMHYGLWLARHIDHNIK